MSPAFLCVEIPNSSGPAGQRNDSPLICVWCTCLFECAHTDATSVCTFLCMYIVFNMCTQILSVDVLLLVDVHAYVCVFKIL